LGNGGEGSPSANPSLLRNSLFGGKYREIAAFEAGYGDVALTSGNKIKVFPPISLRIETGNFAD